LTHTLRILPWPQQCPQNLNGLQGNKQDSEQNSEENQAAIIQNAERTWPEWPEIAGSKRFQANGSRKQ